MTAAIAQHRKHLMFFKHANWEWWWNVLVVPYDLCLNKWLTSLNSTLVHYSSVCFVFNKCVLSSAFWNGLGVISRMFMKVLLNLKETEVTQMLCVFKQPYDQWLLKCYWCNVINTGLFNMYPLMHGYQNYSYIYGLESMCP